MRAIIMVTIESDTPYFHWTFDKLEILNHVRIECGFEGSVWKSDVNPLLRIGESSLTFESPEEWDAGNAPVRFHRTPDGRYEHRSGGIAYDAVRADTKKHVILTGRWTETDFGKGVFIAIFPIKLKEEILLEGAVKIPIESRVPATVARPLREVDS